jgi:hypothetical protein
VDNFACTIFKAYEGKYPLRYTEAKMPIRAVIKVAGAFTPEEVDVLISAFESTLQKIGLAKADPFMLHLYAAFAEKERRLILRRGIAPKASPRSRDRVGRPLIRLRATTHHRTLPAPHEA